MNLWHLIVLLNLFVGMYIYCSLIKHLLSILLSLEFMVVMVFMLFLLFLGQVSFYYSLVYLIVAACEGALGLSILIVMSRSHGGDYLNSLDIMG